MTFLRRISTRQLLALVSAVAALALGIAAVAMAVTGGGPKPPPEPLSVAVHDAVTAPPPPGITARVAFTNHLISSSSIQGSDPILSGGSGRLWAAPDGRLRLELQTDVSSGGGTGDSQILLDHGRFTVYDSGANVAYEGTLPTDSGQTSGNAQPPSLAQVQQEIAKVAEHATLSGAIPSDVAGQPAYTVRVSPTGSGGLIGGAQLAWDAAHGTPLRVAVYARGDSSPVLELKVTDISLGSVPDSVFAVTPPPGAKVTNLSPPAAGAGGSQQPKPVTGLDAVQQQTSFRVAAPQTLAGLSRGEVRLISRGKDTGALITYGKGLGGIAVLELPGGAQPSGASSGSDQGGLQLPKVSINGASGEELDTALGTVVRFQRDGVEYTVAGSIPPAVAEAAARGL